MFELLFYIDIDVGRPNKELYRVVLSNISLKHEYYERLIKMGFLLELNQSNNICHKNCFIYWPNDILKEFILLKEYLLLKEVDLLTHNNKRFYNTVTKFVDEVIESCNTYTRSFIIMSILNFNT